MSLLKPVKNTDFFSKLYYERALRECPKLVAATKSGQPLKDQMLTVVAFNLAYNSFYRGHRLTAIRLLHSVFNSPNLSERIYRAAALLEVQMCIELGLPDLAQSLLLQLTSHSCWLGKASANHLDCWQMLNCRLRTKELVIAEEKTPMQWFLLDVEVQFKSGEARNALNMLLKRRKYSSVVEKRLLDNAIGCIYALTFKDCNMAESYFRSAMLSFSGGVVEFVSEFSPVVPSILLYHTALAQLGSGKPKTAFYIFLAVWPFFRNNPRIWLRVSECCAQNTNATESVNNLNAISDQLHSIAVAGWNAVKCISAAHCSSNFPAEVNCDAEFAAQVVHQGISIALASESAYLLPYLLSLSASVNAQLSRYEESLKAASNLLSLPLINARQKLLAMFYKAEALIHLHRLPEAMVCLEQAVPSVPSQSFSYTLSRLCYNKALAESLAGRAHNAVELLKDISSNNLVQRPENAHLQVYLDMDMRRRLAKQMFKSRSVL